MTVDKLIKLLSKYPPKTKVVLSGDSEGNFFNFAGQVSFPADYLIDDDREIQFLDEDDLADGAKPKGKAIILWP